MASHGIEPDFRIISHPPAPDAPRYMMRISLAPFVKDGPKQYFHLTQKEIETLVQAATVMERRAE